MIWKPAIHNRLAQLADFFTVLLSFYMAYAVWLLIGANAPIIGIVNISETSVNAAFFIAAFCAMFFMKWFGGYSYQRFTSIREEFKLVTKVTLLVVVILVFLLFLFKEADISRIYIAIAGLMVLLMLTIEKYLLFRIAKSVRNKGYDSKDVLIVGTGDIAEDFINTVKNNPHWGLKIAGLLSVDNHEKGSAKYGFNVLDTSDNIENVLKEHKINDVIITIPTEKFDKIKSVIECCEREGIQVRIISNFLGKVAKKMRADVVYDLPIISIAMTHDNEVQIILKRVIDVIGAAAAIVIFSPFMIIAALGIWITDGGPVLYRWNVIGQNKRPFVGWKFRTMVKNADEIKMQLLKQNELDGPAFKMDKDPRVLPFGRWLRKWSIDETPQLFSVLKGDMSLVGPRPIFPYELSKYESWQRRKLSVKPGITCIWQVNGRSDIKKFDDWVKMDLEYIDNWNLALDFKILLKTIPAVMLGKGAK